MLTTLRFTSLILTLLLLFTNCTTNIPKPMISQVKNDIITWDPEDEHGEWKDCSNNMGDHACNFEFIDQHGNEWELYNHYGNIIILDFSTMWCSVCQVAASKAQSIQELYEGRRVIWVTVLIQDLYGMSVSVEDAKIWANTFDITTSPVLAADASIANPAEEKSFSIQSLPTIVIIDRKMVTSYRSEGWSEARILNQIDHMLDIEARN